MLVNALESSIRLASSAPAVQARYHRADKAPRALRPATTMPMVTVYMFRITLNGTSQIVRALGSNSSAVSNPNGSQLGGRKANTLVCDSS